MKKMDETAMNETAVSLDQTVETAYSEFIQKSKKKQLENELFR